MSRTDSRKSQESVDNPDSLNSRPKLLESTTEPVYDFEEKLNELLKIAHEQSRLAHEQSLATEAYDFQNKFTTDIDLLKSLSMSDDFPNTTFSKYMDDHASVEENMEKLFKGTTENLTEKKLQTVSDSDLKSSAEEEQYKVDSTVTSTTPHDQMQILMSQSSDDHDVSQDNESVSAESNEFNSKDVATNENTVKWSTGMETGEISNGTALLTKPLQVASDKMSNHETFRVKIKQSSDVKTKGLKRVKLTNDTANKKFFDNTLPDRETLLPKVVPYVPKQITVTSPRQPALIPPKQIDAEKLPCVPQSINLTSRSNESNILSASASTPPKIVVANDNSPLMKRLASQGISILQCGQGQGQTVARKVLQSPLKQQSEIGKAPSRSDITVLPPKSPLPKLVPVSPVIKTVPVSAVGKTAPLSVYKTVSLTPIQKGVKNYPAKNLNNINVSTGWVPNTQLVQCGICHLNFPNSLALQNHMKTSHGNPQLFRCSLCMNIYNTIGALALHRQTDHANQQCPTVSPGRQIRPVQQNSNMGIPIVNLHNPQTVERLKELGISYYIPVMPSWVKDGNIALPAIPVASSLSTSQLCTSKSELMISLGAVKQINHQ